MFKVLWFHPQYQYWHQIMQFNLNWQYKQSTLTMCDLEVDQPQDRLFQLHVSFRSHQVWACAYLSPFVMVTVLVYSRRPLQWILCIFALDKVELWLYSYCSTATLLEVVWSYVHVHGSASHKIMYFSSSASYSKLSLYSLDQGKSSLHCNMCCKSCTTALIPHCAA